jgi:hypothetical protein
VLFCFRQLKFLLKLCLIFLYFRCHNIHVNGTGDGDCQFFTLLFLIVIVVRVDALVDALQTISKANKICAL